MGKKEQVRGGGGGGGSSGGREGMGFFSVDFALDNTLYCLTSVTAVLRVSVLELR